MDRTPDVKAGKDRPGKVPPLGEPAKAAAPPVGAPPEWSRRSVVSDWKGASVGAPQIARPDSAEQEKALDGLFSTPLEPAGTAPLSSPYFTEPAVPRAQPQADAIEPIAA